MRRFLAGHWMLLTILAVGAVVRAIPVGLADFPLNDGALFASMTEDLQANGYLPPRFASYNGLEIPFTYPPLGFYVAGGFDDLLGISIFDSLRFVPLAFSLASLPVAYLIFRRLLPAYSWALMATAAFAVMPNAYDWLIGGGGLTRSPGFTLALLTILLAIDSQRSSDRRLAIVAGSALGLTALAHPQAFVFASASIVLLTAFLAKPRRKAAAWTVVVIFATAAAIASPWLISALAIHGPGPFVSAGQTGGSTIDGLQRLLFIPFGGGGLNLIGFAVAFGLFVAVVNRWWLIPVWIVALFLLGDRKSPIFSTIPAAMAAAFGLADIARIMGNRARIMGTRVRGAVGNPSRFVDAALVVALLAVGGADAVLSHMDAGPLRVLRSSEREGMVWVRMNSPADATFLVISGQAWNTDAPAEWFPYLAQRKSVSTVQGWEWLEVGSFERQSARHAWLSRCANEGDGVCVDEWTRVLGPVDYVYLTRTTEPNETGPGCCLHLADKLLATGASVVFENDDVIVLMTEKVGSGSTTSAPWNPRPLMGARDFPKF